MKKLILIVLVFTVVISSCNLSTNLPKKNNDSDVRDISPSVVSGNGFLVEETTDKYGTVSLTDPVTNEDVSITILDKETKVGISDIDIAYVSDGEEYLILTNDSSGIYFPIVYESSNSNLSNLQLVSVNQQIGLTEIVIVLTLISKVQTVEDFIDLYQDPPRLEKWGWNYIDSCWTGEQMANATSVAMIFVPGFDDVLGSAFKIVDQALLDMAKIATLGAEYDLENKIKQFNGILRLRVYSAPFPIVTPAGWCLEPLDRTSPNSIVDWVNYGLVNSDIFIFEQLAREKVNLAPDATEWWDNYINDSDFIAEIQIGLTHNPTCDSYKIHDFGEEIRVFVYTTGWPSGIFGTEGSDSFLFWFTNVTWWDDWNSVKSSEIVPGGLFLYGLVYYAPGSFPWSSDYFPCEKSIKDSIV